MYALGLLDLYTYIYIDTYYIHFYKYLNKYFYHCILHTYIRLLTFAGFLFEFN